MKIDNWKSSTDNLLSFFDEKKTKQWVQEGFTKDQTREWIKSGIYNSSWELSSVLSKATYAFFLQDIKKLNSEQFKKLGEDQREELEIEYDKWIKSFIYCDHCQKRILKESFYLIDKKMNLGFCSFDCQLEWNTYAQEWLDRFYSKNNACLREEEGSACWGTITNFKKNIEQITQLNINSQNLTGALDFSNFSNLICLDCSDNKIISLNLTKNIKLEKLRISLNNFLPQNPNWLSHLVNLEDLRMESNKFFGSLEFTKNMTRLRNLWIKQTDLTGLEYLPLSLETISRNDKLDKLLKIYNYNLSLWQATHPELMARVGKKIVNVSYKNIEPEKSTTFPEMFEKKLSEKELLNCENISNYSEFILRDPRHFSWEENKLTNYNKTLPTKLYQVSTNQVIEIKEDKKLNYAIMSYVWGDLSDKENLITWDYTYQTKEGVVIDKQIGVNKEFGAIGTTKESIQALKKAIAVINFINKDLSEESRIDYLWMDQLCINQFDNVEQGNEVPKMRQYYSNAAATLIVIDEKIGDFNREDEYELIKHILSKISSSPWFTRSWTFQEGLLSKQTIFMFNDHLIDGRLLSLVWGSYQKENNSPEKVNPDSQIFITPLGWSYGAQEYHNVGLSLGEALLSVKERKRAISIDGIYSILGLLPYGEEVIPKYKENICKDCKEKEKSLNKTIICFHSNKTEYAKYFVEDLENVLNEVIKQSIDKGYYQDVFSWFGIRSSKIKQFRWIPQIYESGSTNVEKLSNYQLLEMDASLQGIQLKECHVYQIDEIFSDSWWIYARSKWNNVRFKKVKTSENLRIEIGDKLIIISHKKWDLGYSYLSIIIHDDSFLSISVAEIESDDYDEIENQTIFADLINKKIIYGKEEIAIYKELLTQNNKEEINNFLLWNQWKLIHKDFTYELFQQWKEKGFDYQQVYDYVSIFKDDFEILEPNFYIWLKENRLLVTENYVDEYEVRGDRLRIKKTKSILRQKLIIDYHYPQQFKQLSQSYDDINYHYLWSFNELIGVGKILNWTPIKAIIIKEIKISYSKINDSYKIGSLQFTYLIKSNNKWKIFEGKENGIEGNLSSIIKFAKDEYLTRMDWWMSNNDWIGKFVRSLSFHTTNSQGQAKIYGPYGGEEGEGENLSLEINNKCQINVIYGFFNVGGDGFKYLGFFDIYQAPQKITEEDEKVIQLLSENNKLQKQLIEIKLKEENHCFIEESSKKVRN